MSLEAPSQFDYKKRQGVRNDPSHHISDSRPHGNQIPKATPSMAKWVGATLPPPKTDLFAAISEPLGVYKNTLVAFPI